MKTSLFFLLFTVLLSLPLGAQTDEQLWREELEQMRILVEVDSLRAAETAESLLKGKNKKNVPLLVAMSRIYLEADRTTEAEELLLLAKKVDATDPEVSLLEGDLWLARGSVGQACQLYEQAIYFDPHCTEAYLKYARAYRAASPSLAIEKLTRLKALHPECVEADRELAALYYSINRFAKASEAYSRFIDTPVATSDDLLHYAFALFLNHDFVRSLEVARRGLQTDDSSVPFRRLVLYNCVDLQRRSEAGKAVHQLFGFAPDSLITALDHRYHGAWLTTEGRYPEAADQYRRALAKDSTQTVLWLNLSEVCELQGDYAEAISSYLRYYTSLPPERQMPEQLFQLGRLYYARGTAVDTLATAVVSADGFPTGEQRLALLAADSLFTLVDALSPDSYLGDLWRARTNSALDPETTAGLAKPHYEEVAACLLAKADERYNPALIECYSYLGYYHLLQSNYPESATYWEKILLLDPNNTTAGKALEGIRGNK